EQDEKEVFGIGSPAAGPSDWNQPEDQPEEGNGYYIPSEDDIPPNFAWDFANVYKVLSGAQQADVCCNLLFPGRCSCSVCADIKDMVGTNAQFVLRILQVGRQDTLFLAETMKKAKESIMAELFSGSFFYTRRPCKFSKVVDNSIKADKLAGLFPSKDTFYLLDKYCLALTGANVDQPQIVSTPEARSPVQVVLWLLKERLWRGGLLFCLLLRFWRASRMVGSGLIGLKVAEMVVLVFPRAVKPPSSTGSGTLKGGKGIGRGGKKKFLCLFCLLLILLLRMFNTSRRGSKSL
ncbi:hypothetical protein BDZ91DRAFT_769155, partial [Kalaharituber pfeilii]